jgi:hypothetical protein
MQFSPASRLQRISQPGKSNRGDPFISYIWPWLRNTSNSSIEKIALSSVRTWMNVTFQLHTWSKDASWELKATNARICPLCCPETKSSHVSKHFQQVKDHRSTSPVCAWPGKRQTREFAFYVAQKLSLHMCQNTSNKWKIMGQRQRMTRKETKPSDSKAHQLVFLRNSAV